MLRSLGYTLLLLAVVLPGFVLAQGADTAAVMGGVLGGVIGGAPGTAVGAGLGAQVATGGASILDGLMSVAGKSLSYIVFAINYFVGFIGGVIFAFGGFLLQVGLELNARLISSPIVQIGWQVARDIANLGFVIAIIVIAFGTMLRLETYNAKKMLATLVVVALLVNFSLTFAGVFIDASGLISNFFIQQVAPINAGGVNAFAESLAGAFQLQKLHEVKDIGALPEFGGFGGFTASTLGLVASIFFVALFTSLGASIMLIIAGLVVVRYIALSLLLILMPLAMITYVFPKLKNNWQRWLKSFSDWLVFLPVMLFFLYLAILVVTNFSDDPNSVMRIAASVEAGSSDFLDQFLMTIADTLQIFAQMVVVLALLAGGLIVAKSFSLQFSSSIISAVEGGRKWALKKAGRAASAPIRGGGRWAGREILKSDTAKKVVSTLSKIPGLRRAGSALAGQITSSQESTKQEVENYRTKHLRNLPTAADVHSYTRSRVIPDVLMPVARAAEIAELAERGKIDEVLGRIPAAKRNGVIEQWLKAAKLAGIEGNILQSKPDWAPRVGRDIKRVVPKIKDVNKVSESSLRDTEVVASLSSNQLKAIRGTSAKRAIKEVTRNELDRIKSLYGLSDKDVDGFTRLDMRVLRRRAVRRGRTIEQEVALREQAIDRLRSIKGISSSDFEKLKSFAGLRRIITNNPSWQII